MESRYNIMHFLRLIKTWLKMLFDIALFLQDYLLCLLEDQHTARPSTYALLRKVYSVTKGKSVKVLSFPFQVLHPPRQSTSGPDVTAIAETIAERGYCKQEPLPGIASVAEALHKRLSLCSVHEVVQSSKPGFLYKDLESALKLGRHKAARLAHVRRDVCLMPETWELIRKLRLRDVASIYLGCDPILTSVDSWHVVPLTLSSDSNSLYSAAAQTYHYDMDWIRFLKIFINLTPATMDSGPLEYVPFSHTKKNVRYFRDGRFEQLIDEGTDVAFASGNPGSTFFADTSGIHRDGRALGANRHVLQVEFSVSSFGSKFQYNDVYKSCRDAVHPIRNKFPASSRMFALF